MQGYADRDLPAQPISHIAALVTAPLPIAQSMQANLASEAAKLHITVDDAQSIFPPTRQYTDAEIKHDLKDRGVDGVLVVNVGDSGIVQQYLGTVLSGGYSGVENGVASVNSFGGISTVSYGGTVSGSSYAVASPIYRPTRQTTFSARLVDPITGRNLWIGNGDIKAGGKLFVGDETSASKAAAAIFEDLHAKHILGSGT
jgi:hypothetical protein